MPIYDYQCTACSHRMEALQKISDDPLKKCPECEQDTLKKQLTAAAFHLKGTGWYETDFKDKKDDKGADNKGASKTDSNSNIGADSSAGADSGTKDKTESKSADTTSTAKKETPAKSTDSAA